MRAHKLSTLDLARHSQLSGGDLVIGEPTRQELRKLKEDQQKAQLLGIRAFFTAVAAFLQTRLPFENKLLRFLSCLNPDRRSDTSLRAIEFVASKLRTPAADIANVSGEWRLYIYDEERSGNLRKAQELIITGMTSFNSRQQMETRDTLC